MTIKYHTNVIQGTEEWHDLRNGIITASQVKTLLTPKLKIAANDKTRASGYEMIAQRATNHTEEIYQTWAMQRGHVEEIYAKDLYAKHKAPIKECGFITNDDYHFTLGFSPDGLIGDDGLIECKSRGQRFQAETIIKNEVPSEYMLQIQTGLLVTKRKWCDFISYSNGMPMFIKRVEPDHATFEMIVEACRQFELMAEENMKKYVENSADLIKTERRDHETGEVMKPSAPANETDNLTMAG